MSEIVLNRAVLYLHCYSVDKYSDVLPELLRVSNIGCYIGNVQVSCGSGPGISCKF